MLIALLVSATLMKGLHSVPCTEKDKFHTEIYNNACYVISFERKDFKDSIEFCRDLGGYLTDLEENGSAFFKVHDCFLLVSSLYYKMYGSLFRSLLNLI